MNNQSMAYAELLCTRGQYGEAIKTADRELQSNPNDAEALALRSISLAGMGNFEGAISEARRALSINAENANAHYAIAAIALKRGCQTTNTGIARITYLPDRNRHLAEATNAIAEALRLNPGNVHFNTIHARILASQKKWLEAIAVLKRTYDGVPEDIEPLTLLAELLLMSHKTDEAAQVIDQSLAIAPGSAQLHAMRGHLFLLTNRPHLAIDSFLEALRIIPTKESYRQDALESFRQCAWLYRIPARLYFQLLQRLTPLIALPIIALGVLLARTLSQVAHVPNPHPTLFLALVAIMLLFTLLLPTTIGNFLVQFRPRGVRLLNLRELLFTNALVGMWTTLIAFPSLTSYRSSLLAPLVGFIVFSISLAVAILIKRATRPSTSRRREGV